MDKFFKFTVLVFTIFSLFTATAFANTTTNMPVSGFSDDPQKAAAFEQKFLPFLKKWKVPGASIVVLKDSQVTMNRGYGWADKASGKPMPPDALFRIASVSKTFTAVAILKLVQDGKLKLNDRVFDILNDLKPLNGRVVNPKIYQITVQNLLQMSSGWTAHGSSDPIFGPWPAKMTAVLGPELPATCETIARYMMSQPLRFKPGTGYDYSNLDYCVLGLIIGKVGGYKYTHHGYETYIQNELLAPLGIHEMYIGSTQQQYRTPNEVTHYRSEGMSPEEEKNSFYLPYSHLEILRKNFGSGGWVARPKDLGIFIQALSQGRILNLSYLGLMQQKPSFVPAKKINYYTMGGMIYNLNGQRYWLQTGSFTGTNALVVTKPDGTTIVAVFNYRPDAYSFLSKFRPELRRLLINSNL